MKYHKKVCDSAMDNWLLILFILLIGSIIYSMVFATYETFKNVSTSGINTGKKLVLFYTDTCPHCTAMLNDWNTAAKKVNTGTQKMIKINSTKNKDLANKYNITSYPTILLLSNGKLSSTYTGSRNATDFENYVKSNIQ
jgi:thioredoxin-like negative regulator of GroEL